jgi:hypothetical protein
MTQRTRTVELTKLSQLGWTMDEKVGELIRAMGSGDRIVAEAARTELEHAARRIAKALEVTT